MKIKSIRFALGLILLLPSLCFATTYKLMTYNILSDKYIGFGEFDKLPHEVIRWDKRKVRLINKITSLSPDILCLQEVEPEVFEEFSHLLAPYGYAGIDGGLVPNKDRVVVFYKHMMVKPQDVKIERYPNNNSKTFMMIKFQSDNDVFWVIHSKMKWHHSIDYDHHVGAQQIKYLGERLHLIGNEPALMCGDFNVTPQSQWLEPFREKFKDPYMGYAYVKLPQHYAQNRVDYILHTANVKATPIIPEVWPTDLPSLEYASDHMPLYTSFEIVDNA